jgi:hypothetical protein
MIAFAWKQTGVKTPKKFAKKKNDLATSPGHYTLD